MSATTIQGRQLFKGGNYSRKYGMCSQDIYDWRTISWKVLFHKNSNATSKMIPVNCAVANADMTGCLKSYLTKTKPRSLISWGTTQSLALSFMSSSIGFFHNEISGHFSCSPDPTTNYETTNPALRECFVSIRTSLQDSFVYFYFYFFIKNNLFGIGYWIVWSFL